METLWFRPQEMEPADLRPLTSAMSMVPAIILLDEADAYDKFFWADLALDAHALDAHTVRRLNAGRVFK